MSLAASLFWFSIILSTLNWLIFAGLTFLDNAPAFRKLLDELVPKKGEQSDRQGMDRAQLQASEDHSKLVSAVAALATAFGKSGSAASAAAMAVFFALIAAIASGVSTWAQVAS